MTYKEIAQKIDKSPANKCFCVLESVARELEFDDIYLYYAEQDRLVAYWIGAWYDTEGWCGYRLYFFDDVPVAFSAQRNIGDHENFQWFSQECALKVKDYILSLLPAKELEVYTVNIDTDCGDCFHVPFSAQVLDWNKARYNGMLLNSVERIKEKPDYGIDRKVKIKLPAGEEKIVDVRDLEFQFHLT